MKIKILIPALKGLLYGLIIAVWGGILCGSIIFVSLNRIVADFGNGILKLIFIVVYICAVTLSIIFYRKSKLNFKKPIILLIFVIAALIINIAAYCAAENYVSVYSRQKWDNNEKLRIYMIDDLESQYNFDGKSENEVINLLGEPNVVSENNFGKKFEYYIGDDHIDPYTYDVIFNNGFAVKTGIVQH